MLQQINQSSKPGAKKAVPSNQKKMEDISSKNCRKIRMPREIVLVGELGEGDTGFVFNDSYGLFADYGINQANSAALVPSKKVSAETLRNYLMNYVPVISLINYSSSESAQLDNPVLFETVMYDGRSMREDLFEVATAERNTQFVDNLQTIMLKPKEEVYISGGTGIAIDSNQAAGTTVTLALKVEEWIPFSTFFARMA